MLEAQQVGDMCFKYKKNLYNIAYVAGVLTYQREEKSRDFQETIPQGKERRNF